MARIERRQHRLRRLRTRFQAASGTTSTPNINTEPAFSPDAHYHIGKSQNEYEPIGTFLSSNAGDPAVQVLSPNSQFCLYKV